MIRAGGYVLSMAGMLWCMHSRIAIGQEQTIDYGQAARAMQQDQIDQNQRSQRRRQEREANVRQQLSDDRMRESQSVVEQQLANEARHRMIAMQQRAADVLTMRLQYSTAEMRSDLRKLTSQSRQRLSESLDSLADSFSQLNIVGSITDDQEPVGEEPQRNSAQTVLKTSTAAAKRSLQQCADVILLEGRATLCAFERSTEWIPSPDKWFHHDSRFSLFPSRQCEILGADFPGPSILQMGVGCGDIGFQMELDAEGFEHSVKAGNTGISCHQETGKCEVQYRPVFFDSNGEFGVDVDRNINIWGPLQVGGSIKVSGVALKVCGGPGVGIGACRFYVRACSEWTSK